MDTNEYQTTRIWKKSLKRLRQIAAENDESIVEVIERLALQEQRKESKPMSAQYVEWHTLQTRGAVDPGPDEEVEGTLLVGIESVLSFYANQSSYGEDSVSIFPAFHNGVRSWVKRDVWCPAYGYSASGTNEYILSFEDGVKLFLERGVFEFPVPAEAKQA